MTKKDIETEKPEAAAGSTEAGSPNAGESADKAKGKAKDDKPTEEELSEEDQQLKGELEMLVERLKEDNTELYAAALTALKNFIRTSTSSMTAVPKPLKFLRPHYTDLTALYDTWTDAELKRALADVLSVLGMTYADTEKRESLHYRLLAVSDEIGNWGHEYVRHLALEIGEEYQVRAPKEESTEDLMALALQIVPFFLKHNAEADAVDLLLEIEAIEKLPPFVDADTYARVCLYMVSCVNLLPPPDDKEFLRTAYSIYLSQGKLTQAMALAVRLDDHESVQAVFDATDDKLIHKQLAFILARQQIWIEVEDDEIQECLSNTRLSENFLLLGKELNILDPKVPEDIYKSHLEHSRGIDSGLIDSAKQNLASSFVNAFINAGFGKDKLLMPEDESNSFIYKNKDSGMMSATAGIATILQWDVENGLQQFDKYLYSSEEHVKAGALLGIGMINTSVHNDSDPALALLCEYMDDPSVPLRLSAIMGLGLAYAGSKRNDLYDMLYLILVDSSLSMQLVSMAALSLGLIFVGTCHGEITETILQTMMERDDAQLSDKWGRFMALGLGLLYMGKQDDADATIETLKAIEHPIGRNTSVLVDICSFAGTGNVLKIQNLLHLCSEKPDQGDDDDSSAQKTDDLYQGYAVLGVAMIAMGEDIGQEMVLRQFGHLMHYGEGAIRRAVPLAMGLISASNPQIKVFDTLSRYSHDNDIEVAINAIFAMGLVGAGTNNARLAQLLRQLASYYSKDPNSLFMVRIAQGLLHLGKGTMSLSPFHTERQIMSNVAMAGLLTVLVSLIDASSFVLDSSHYLLHFLTPALHPRFLITLDPDLKPIHVNVRVGQAVDVVGQAGRPKTITGWVTHSTPVLLGHGERAELEDDEYVAIASTLEGIVILKKNETAEE
ncbi:armadillo-type protein [Dipodascopsis tothii]|uniref:armadillo-type protein n=1 Tax=Dipodascopsis tothii TaxID=44089 RepID=UPI0034CED7B5